VCPSLGHTIFRWTNGKDVERLQPQGTGRYMFSDFELAREVHDRLIEVQGLLATSVSSLKGRCDEQEYRAYRGVIGQALGILITDALGPIEIAHPTLKPTE
jgi:hypothetical protein